MQNTRWWNGIVGGVSGLALVSGVCQFWLNAGTSLPAQTALAVTVIVAVLASVMLPVRWRFGLVSPSIRLFVLSAWSVVLPSLFGAAWQVIEWSGFDFSSSLVGQCCCLTLLAFVTLEVPAICSLSLIVPERRASFGVAFAAMFATGGLGLATLIGPDGCGLLSSVCGLIAFVTLLVRGSRDNVGQVFNLPVQPAKVLKGQVENLPTLSG